jgi:hypothetical protein
MADKKYRQAVMPGHAITDNTMKQEKELPGSEFFDDGYQTKHWICRNSNYS